MVSAFAWNKEWTEGFDDTTDRLRQLGPGWSWSLAVKYNFWPTNPENLDQIRATSGLINELATRYQLGMTTVRQRFLERGIAPGAELERMADDFWDGHWHAVLSEFVADCQRRPRTVVQPSSDGPETDHVHSSPR